MAKMFQSIEPAHREFIARQKIFFNASAAPDGHVNVSPRGAALLRVLDDHTVIYLDLTGSGNETAAHVRLINRVTLMFCAFEGPPMILRLYGKVEVLRRGGAEYRELLADHFGNNEPLGARQMMRVTVDRVQTSCGYNVPQFRYVAERDTLTRWAEAKGPEGLDAYRLNNNAHSIDNFPTGMFDPESS